MEHAKFASYNVNQPWVLVWLHRNFASLYRRPPRRRRPGGEPNERLSSEARTARFGAMSFVGWHGMPSYHLSSTNRPTLSQSSCAHYLNPMAFNFAPTLPHSTQSELFLYSALSSISLAHRLRPPFPFVNRFPLP